jgi:TonB-linked SusC/RagA family outer membrane protein
MPYPYLSKYLVLLLIIAGCSFTAAAQQYTVTGKVIAATDQLPVPGTVVRVADSSRNATATEPSGKFRILVHKGQKIIVSYLGYEEQSFVINDNQELNITLVSKVNKVDEVVVIGYGAVKKSHLTGAVSKVTNDNLDQIPVSRVDDALMGKLAGVSVQKTDAQAGAEPTIQIRGATSITAGTSPLIVIDGYPVPTDLSAIDMSDVESIEVLKDAASAAMYGSRGGNGVLLVTTKSGRANRQRIGINLASGMKQVYRKLPRTSLSDWKNYVAAQNNGEIPAQISLAEQYDANSDIQDAIFRTSNYTNAGVNANGGNSTVRYYLGGTFMRDDGVMKGNDYRRYGGKVGLDANLNKKLKAGITFTPSYTEFYNVSVDAQEAVRNAPSWLPLYHTEQTAAATGKPVGSYASQRDFDPNRNPAFQGISLSASTSNSTLAMIDGISDKRTNIRNILNSYIQYNFNPYLYFKATAGYTGSHNERNYFQKSWARADAILDGEAYARTTSSAIFSQTKLTDLLNEDMLFYKRSFGKHDVDAIVGFSIQKTSWDNITGTANNFATDEIPTLNAGVMQSLSSSREVRTLMSEYARVMYAYNDKYLFSLSGRYDASSRFGKNNRWGFFPAGSAGWNISRESFFPSSRILTDMKLRASFGATGNENIGNYVSYATVAPATAIIGGDNVTPGFTLTGYGNPDLGWERTYSYNLGTDLTFLKGKLTASVEYYKSYTDNLLLNLPIPSATGFTGYYVNQGKVENQGFEGELSYKIISKKTLRWSVSGNIYTNKNKLIDFGGTQTQISQGDPKRANYFITQTGQPLTQFYGYVVDSVVSMQGTNYWPQGVTALHVFVRDVNGDGKIDDNDRIVLGNPYPKVNWGFTTNIGYKNFDLSITLQGSHGARIFNIDPYYYETQYGTTGATAYQNYPLEMQQSVRLKTETNLEIQDASFVALRNVNLGYSFSGKAAKKIGMTGLRCYLSAANLLYLFADNYTSLNPEANNTYTNDPLRKGYQRGAIPIARTITFGINTNF